MLLHRDTVFPPKYLPSAPLFPPPSFFLSSLQPYPSPLSPPSSHLSPSSSPLPPPLPLPFPSFLSSSPPPPSTPLLHPFLPPRLTHLLCPLPSPSPPSSALPFPHLSSLPSPPPPNLLPLHLLPLPDSLFPPLLSAGYNGHTHISPC